MWNSVSTFIFGGNTDIVETTQEQLNELAEKIDGINSNLINKQPPVTGKSIPGQIPEQIPVAKKLDVQRVERDVPVPVTVTEAEAEGPYAAKHVKNGQVKVSEHDSPHVMGKVTELNS